MIEQDQKADRLREMVAEVLEIEPEELTDDGDFTDDYDAYGQPRRQVSLAVPRHRDYRVPAPAGAPYLGTLAETQYAQRDDAERRGAADHRCRPRRPRQRRGRDAREPSLRHGDCATRMRFDGPLPL